MKNSESPISDQAGITPGTIGYVAIGRNEGERLVRCLSALKKLSHRVVYVDSASDDDSVQWANKNDIQCLELDMDRPFTAARARNEGFAALMAAYPDTDLVMFIDGDCEVDPEFPGKAAAKIAEEENLALVTGRCKELFPEKTPYNQLCDLEWIGPIGEIDACGGIFMIRRTSFEAIKGFNEKVIAAEDDELCIRLRAAGYKLWRIDHTLCLHDADMHHFSQWWHRARRAGYAYALVGGLHEGYFSAPRRRAWFWAGALPLVILGLAPFTAGFSLVLTGLYILSFIRTRARLITEGIGANQASLHARFLVLAKFPNLLGIVEYHLKRMTGRAVEIVEYK